MNLPYSHDDVRAPLCAPLPVPAEVEDHEAFVVPLVISLHRATEVARQAILKSFLRPADIAAARIEPPVLVYLPFWRVEASASGFHVGLHHATGSDGRLRWVLPTGGANHRNAVLLVNARRLFPYAPSLVDVPGTFTRGFSIALEQMVPRHSISWREGEVIQPDVSRATAEREATDRVLRAVQPSSALYSKYVPKVQSIAFCHYPLFVTRYHYEGHAKRHDGEAYFVTISGRSGELVGGHHPSTARALAAKFRRMLSF